MEYHLATFYKFMPLAEEDLSALKEQLISGAEARDVKALILIAPEGVNGGFAGSKEGYDSYCEFLQSIFGSLNFKYNTSDVAPYKKLKVKIKKEIVALKKPELHPESENNNHLTPEEFHQMLQQEDVIIIDTRNDYETKIGKFKQAIDPHTENFSEFPEFVKKSGIPKDKKVLMYCTEGIRCEKASIEMQEQGYKEVYQLKDGIINYIRQFPNQEFEGECFVFDHRVAVGQDLQPSKSYRICPHCGEPGNIDITCIQCSKQAKACANCIKEDLKNTCSKNCRYLMSIKA